MYLSPLNQGAKASADTLDGRALAFDFGAVVAPSLDQHLVAQVTSYFSDEIGDTILCILCLRGEATIDIDVTQDSLKIYIEKDLKLKFKALCALQDKDMSEVAAGLIADWVRHNESPSQQQKGK